MSDIGVNTCPACGVDNGLIGLCASCQEYAMRQAQRLLEDAPAFRAYAEQRMQDMLATPDLDHGLRKGQVWRHLRNGHEYQILRVNIEAAGVLRDQNPTGNLHLYQCLSTHKPYARLTHHWPREREGFELVSEMVPSRPTRRALQKELERQTTSVVWLRDQLERITRQRDDLLEKYEPEAWSELQQIRAIRRAEDAQILFGSGVMKQDGTS